MVNSSAKAIKNHSKSSPWRRHLLKVVLIVIAIVMLFVSCSVIRKWSTALSMSNYLRKKYNQEFVVEEPSLSAAGLGVEGTWGADAHPVSSKDTTFRIIKAENRNSFSDRYTAKIWSQRETARLNKVAQQNVSNSKWKVKVSAEIYLAEPLADTALPDNPKVEEIIRQDYGPAYNVNLSYFELQNTSYDDIVRDMERIANSVTNSGIKNVNYNYSITNIQGIIKKCKTTYDKPFDNSYDNIKNCLR